MREMESIMFANLSKYKKLFEKRYAKLSDRYNLRKIDTEIIVYLAKCGDNNTARDIAATNMFTKGHISQSVKRLSEMGYVEAVHDESDMRVQHLYLTDKVDSLLNEMKGIRQEMEECVFKGITKEQTKVMMEVYNIMCDNIMKEMNRLEDK